MWGLRTLSAVAAQANTAGVDLSVGQPNFWKSEIFLCTVHYAATIIQTSEKNLKRQIVHSAPYQCTIAGNVRSRAVHIEYVYNIVYNTDIFIIYLSFVSVTYATAKQMASKLFGRHFVFLFSVDIIDIDR